MRVLGLALASVASAVGEVREDVASIDGRVGVPGRDLPVQRSLLAAVVEAPPLHEDLEKHGERISL